MALRYLTKNSTSYPWPQYILHIVIYITSGFAILLAASLLIVPSYDLHEKLYFAATLILIQIIGGFFTCINTATHDPYLVTPWQYQRHFNLLLFTIICTLFAQTLAVFMFMLSNIWDNLIFLDFFLVFLIGILHPISFALASAILNSQSVAVADEPRG